MVAVEQPDGTPSAPLPVAGILLTFRRPRELAVMLEALDRQTHRLDPVVVVDNDPARSAEDLARERPGLVYVAVGDNSGPAGGIHHGLARLPAGTEWVMLLDDDDPPRATDTVEQSVGFLTAAVHHDPACAAVGIAGSTFDLERGRSSRPDRGSTGRMMPVDWIGSNQFPVYSVAALRECAVPAPDLFWGYEELEIGLALRAAGHTLYRDRDHRYGTGLEFALPKTTPRWAPWRAYYTVRNLVHIMRTRSTSRAALRAGLRCAFGRLRECPPAQWPQAVPLLLRALRDGWAGRLGRSVEPG